MVALLTSAGYSASYVLGDIQLTSTQVASWLNTDNTSASNVADLLSNGGIPNTVTANSDGSLNNVVLTHMWVQASDGTNTYVFDPSLKSYNYTTGINLANAMGFNLANFIHDAQIGMNYNPAPTAIQNVNRTYIRKDLDNYAINLINWIRNNNPGAKLQDIIGGKTLIQVTAPEYNTTLPYQTGTPTVYSTIPDNYRTTLEIQFQGIDETYYSDDIYGQRLTLFFNSNNQPILYLAGVAQSNSGAAVIPGTVNSITFTVTLPFSANPNVDTQNIVSVNPYFLANSWGK